MRILLRAFGALCTIMLFLLLYWNIYQKDAVRENTERTLTRSVEQVVQEVKIKSMFAYENLNEMQADFVKSLSESDTTAGILKVRFYQTDKEQGLMDVEVIKTFPYPTGQTGEIIIRRTVITEELPNDPYE